MQIDSLKYFMDVAQEKSISKAAQNLHISQSALSQNIQKLEEDIGQTLFVRSNKGVELTEVGEIVLKYSKNIIKNFEKMFDEIKSFEEEDHKIYISGTSSLVAYSLPCVIYKVKKKFPKNKYELIGSTVERTISDIENYICDFGFIDERPNEKNGFFVHKMGKEKVVLIAHTKKKIPDSIKLEDLFKLDFINWTLNSHINQVLERELVKANKSVKDRKVVFDVDSLSAVKSSVMNGLGVALVPYESIKHELYEKKIKIIQIEDVVLDYDIYLVSKKQAYLSKSAKESLEYLIEIGRKSFC